jgi:hypothetical protein
MSFRRTAVLAALLAGAVAVSPAPSQAGTKQDCKKSKKSKKCPPAVKEGRMTGHGHEFNVNGWDKVQWEFRNSVCNDDRFPDLKVEFGPNKFVLTEYASPGLICFTLNPNAPSTEGHPVAGFDSIRATGTGTLNGVRGAGITFRFTDSGEPGRADTAVFTITAPNGSIAYSGGALDGGNHQAHRK